MKQESKKWSYVEKVLGGEKKETPKETSQTAAKIKEGQEALGDDIKMAQEELNKRKEKQREEYEKLREILKTRPLTEEERERFQKLTKG